MFFNDFYKINRENIIQDITKLIGTKNMNMKEFNEKISKMKCNIKEKTYSLEELDFFVNIFRKNINQENFTSENFTSTMSEDISNGCYNSDNLMNNIFKVIIETIISIFTEMFELIIICMIVVHLSFRSNFNSSIFYPKNESKFPYVFFDKSTKNSQDNIVSCVPRTELKSDLILFEDINIISDNAGNADIKKNHCAINDPYNATKMCIDNVNNYNKEYTYDETFSNFFEKKISKNNMNIFARLFINSHKNKQSSELSIFSMITYTLLMTTIKLNGMLGSIDTFFKPFFNYVFSKSVNINQYIIVLFITIFSVITFKTLFMQTGLDYSINSYLNRLSSINKNNSINWIFYEIYVLFSNIIRSITNPFSLFCMIFFMIIYPVSLFFVMWCYIDYSNYSTSLITRAFCFFGIGVTLFNMLKFLQHNLSTIKLISEDIDNDEKILIKDYYITLYNLVKDEVKRFFDFIRKDFNRNDILFNNNESFVTSSQEGFKEGMVDSNGAGIWEKPDPTNITNQNPVTDADRKKVNQMVDNCQKNRKDKKSMWKCLKTKGVVPGLYGNWVFPKSETWDPYPSDSAAKTALLNEYKKKAENEKKHQSQECKNDRGKYTSEDYCKKSNYAVPWWWLQDELFFQQLDDPESSYGGTEEEGSDEYGTFGSIWEAGSYYAEQTFGDMIGFAEGILSCNPKNWVNSLKNFLKVVATLMFGPILLIYIFIPIIVSLILTLKCSKSISFDYLYLLKTIQFQLNSHVFIILLIFFGILYSKWSELTGTIDSNGDYRCFSSTRKITFLICVSMLLFSSVFSKLFNIKNSKTQDITVKTSNI